MTCRYAGVIGCRDYRRAFEIIKAGNYASSLDYVDKLCAVVERWNLTRFDNVAVQEPGVIHTLSVADVWTREEAEKFMKQYETKLASIGLRGVIHKVKILE